MIGSVTERLAPSSNYMVNGTNGTESVDTAARDAYRVQIACALSVLTGLFQVCVFNFSGDCLGLLSGDKKTLPELSPHPHLRSFWVW